MVGEFVVVVLGEMVFLVENVVLCCYLFIVGVFVLFWVNFGCERFVEFLVFEGSLVVVDVLGLFVSGLFWVVNFGRKKVGVVVILLFVFELGFELEFVVLLVSLEIYL